jgi:predicted neutral ceramidase superfamily lipid hydrolase
VNEHLTRSQTHPAPSGLVGSGRLPARLRHRRILRVPPAPSHAGPSVHGAA